MKTPNTLIEEIVDEYVSGDRNERASLDIERLLKDFTLDITDYACAWFEKYLAEIGYPDDWCKDSEMQESGEKRFQKSNEETVMTTQIDDKYKSPYEDYEWEEGYDVWESGFAKGMQCMLEKAMALIEDCVVFDKFGKPVKSETFRKAMEE